MVGITQGEVIVRAFFLDICLVCFLSLTLPEITLLDLVFFPDVIL